MALEKAQALAKRIAEEKAAKEQAEAAAEAARIAEEQILLAAEYVRQKEEEAEPELSFPPKPTGLIVEDEEFDRPTGLVIKDEEFDNAYNRPTGLGPKKFELSKYSPPSFDLGKYSNTYNRPTGFGSRNKPAEKPKAAPAVIEETETPPASDDEQSFGSYKRSDGLKAFSSRATTPAPTSTKTETKSSDDAVDGGWSSYISKWRRGSSSTTKTSAPKPISSFKPTYKPFDFSSAFDVSKYLRKPKKPTKVVPPPKLDTTTKLDWLNNLTEDMPEDAPSTPTEPAPATV